MESLGYEFKRIKDRLSNPMPDWAFCENRNCGLLLINVPGVREMVAARIGENRVDEPPVCKCDENRQIAIRRRFIASGIPHQSADDYPRSFDNFGLRPGTEKGMEATLDFMKNSVVILVLMGRTGSGKSHLAESICRDYLGRNIQARYEYVPRLLDSMRGVSGDDVHTIMTRSAECRVLALDDLGLEKGSEWTNERLTAIVEDRLTRHAKTIITTNKTKDELIGMGYERLASRMFGVGTGEAVVAALTPKTDYRETGAETTEKGDR